MLRRLLLALVGIALIVWLISRVGTEAIAAQLSHVGANALWLIVPYSLGTIIGAFPWPLLIPEPLRPPCAAVVLSRFAASGANALLPLFGVAGEPSRLLWLAPSARSTGLAAMVADRVLYNCASALFLTCGSVVAWLATPLPKAVAASAAGLSIAILGVTLFLGWGAVRFGVGHRFQRIARKLRPAHESPGEFGVEVDAQLKALLASGPRLLFLSVFVHFIGRVILGAELYVALWILDINPSFATAFVVATVPVATAAVGSAIPSQLGVQESGQALVCAALGMDPAVGLSVVLLTRIRQVAFAPLTPLLLSTARGTVVA